MLGRGARCPAERASGPGHLFCTQKTRNEEQEEPWTRT
jgi:hypothetical protein